MADTPEPTTAEESPCKDRGDGYCGTHPLCELSNKTHRAEIDRLRIQVSEQRLKLEGRSKCEGCGLTTSREDEYTRIHVLNGVLCLCKQCLFDVNRKNPELITLQQHADALAAGLELAQLWLANSVPTTELDGPKPLPVISALLAAHRARTGESQ